MGLSRADRPHVALEEPRLLYGLPWQDDWEFGTFLDVIHPDDRPRARETIRQSLAPGGPDHYAFDFRVIHPDQSIHWLSVVGQVVERGPDGSGMTVRGTLTDVTERKRASLRLRSQPAVTKPC